MRNGSVFRLQGPVWLNGDGSLLFATAGVCCTKWYGSQHDTQLIKSILQGNVWWAQFQFNNMRGLGVCAHMHECVCVPLWSVCACSTQNKGQGHCVCLQYAFEMRSSTENKGNKRFSWSSETHGNRNLFPISDDRLADCGNFATSASKW